MNTLRDSYGDLLYAQPGSWPTNWIYVDNVITQPFIILPIYNILVTMGCFFVCRDNQLVMCSCGVCVCVGWGGGGL